VKPGDVRTHLPSSGLTLLSFDSMSATTTQHLSQLNDASPFDVVRVPMRRGDRDFTPESLARLFAEELKSYAEGLNDAKNRRKFMALLDALHRLREDACEKWAEPLRGKALMKFDKLDVSKIAEEIKAQNRKSAAKAAAETRAVFAKYTKNRTGADYCDFVRTLFEPMHRGAYRFTDTERAILRNKILATDRQGRRKSYVWLDGDEVATSQHVRVPLKEAKTAMHAWALGKDMRTFEVGGYKIVVYQGDTIQIGCHRIPRENMLALYEAVMGKPFPAKHDNAPEKQEAR